MSDLKVIANNLEQNYDVAAPMLQDDAKHYIAYIDRIAGQVCQQHTIWPVAAEKRTPGPLESKLLDLNVPVQNGKLYPDQRLAIRMVLDFLDIPKGLRCSETEQGVMLVAPAGSGKTMMQLVTAYLMVKRGWRVLVIYHSHKSYTDMTAYFHGEKTSIMASILGVYEDEFHSEWLDFCRQHVLYLSPLTKLQELGGAKLFVSDEISMSHIAKRVPSARIWLQHNVDAVLMDEAHCFQLQTSAGIKMTPLVDFLAQTVKHGHVGFTASPPQNAYVIYRAIGRSRCPVIAHLLPVYVRNSTGEYEEVTSVHKAHQFYCAPELQSHFLESVWKGMAFYISKFRHPVQALVFREDNGLHEVFCDWAVSEGKRYGLIHPLTRRHFTALTYSNGMDAGFHWDMLVNDFASTVGWNNPSFKIAVLFAPMNILQMEQAVDRIRRFVVNARYPLMDGNQKAHVFAPAYERKTLEHLGIQCTFQSVEEYYQTTNKESTTSSRKRPTTAAHREETPSGSGKRLHV